MVKSPQLVAIAGTAKAVKPANDNASRAKRGIMRRMCSSPCFSSIKSRGQPPGISSKYSTIFLCRSNHVENSKRRRRYGRAPLNTSIEHPTKFDVVTNLEALGLTISQTLLAAADEVVE